MSQQGAKWETKSAFLLRPGVGAQILLADMGAVHVGVDPVSYTHLDVYKRQAGLLPVAAVGDTVHLVVGVAEDGAVDTCEQFGTGLAHGFLTPDKC